MHRVRACVDAGSERSERSERETRVRVIHEFRVYSHIHVLCYAKNCRWHIGCEGRESATEIPLMCLSAVNVAYRNPVSRFRVATRRPLLVLSNVIKAPLFLMLNVPWASERINSQSCASLGSGSWERRISTTWQWNKRFTESRNLFHQRQLWGLVELTSIISKRLELDLM